jgi:hypothetical protein
MEFTEVSEGAAHHGGTESRRFNNAEIAEIAGVRVAPGRTARPVDRASLLRKCHLTPLGHLRKRRRAIPAALCAGHPDGDASSAIPAIPAFDLNLRAPVTPW